jgi:DNA-directed RNA polymerase beta subunit
MMISTYWSEATPHHTHAEIHPSLIFSTTTALIPFPEMNQAPRNMYYSSMAAQAVGVYSTNPDARFDTIAHNLWCVIKCALHTCFSRARL